MFSRTDFKRRRLTAGLTQTALAEKVGISQQLVSNIESGVCGPSPSVAVRIADVFGCAVTDLLVDEVAS